MRRSKEPAAPGTREAAVRFPPPRSSRSPAAVFFLLWLLLPAAAAPAADEKAAKSGVAAGAAAPAKAAEVREAAEPRTRETIYSLILKGRWIMIPMGICSVFVLALAIERLISLRQARVGTPRILDEIFRELPPRGRATRENVLHATAICEDSRSILGEVLRTGVEKIHRDEAHAQTYIEETAAKLMHVLKRKVRPFSVISSLGPLLGLLGTISGMITCFENATVADATSRVATLTRGIYEALVATATGLLIAILSLILYHYFQGRVERIGDRIDEAATKFMDHYYGIALLAKPRGTAAVHASQGGAAHPIEAGTTRDGGISGQGEAAVLEAGA